MRHPFQALTWQFWSANRRGWFLLLLAVTLAAAPANFFGASFKHSEPASILLVLGMVFSLLLVMAFCDFTDRDPRAGFAGYPRRLFTMPVRTALLVFCPMLWAVIAVVGMFIAWAMLVIRPAGMNIEIGWPALLLATAAVGYQTGIWCLSGFRVARIVVMSLGSCVLVTIACLPALLPSLGYSPEQSQMLVRGVQIAICGIGYLLAVLVVGAQRRGEARGSNLMGSLFDSIGDRLSRPVLGTRRRTIRSPAAALFWMEWRRNGWVLPAAVLFVVLMIVGPLSGVGLHDAHQTAWTAMWLSVMPILLAMLIGKGVAKPDFWSLDLSLSPFLSTRPVTSGQIVAAKIKSAACSAILAWVVLLAIGLPYIFLTGNLHDLNEVGQIMNAVYSHARVNAIVVLMTLAAVTVTWGLLIGNIWIGMCGRGALFYTLTGASIVVTIHLAILVGCVADDPDWRAAAIAYGLRWLPWIMATLAVAKIWPAMLAIARLRQRRLASGREIGAYLCAWSLATALMIALAWMIAPEVIWIRNLLILGAVLAIPLARIAAAPMALAQNRHR